MKVIKKRFGKSVNIVINDNIFQLENITDDAWDQIKKKIDTSITKSQIKTGSVLIDLLEYLKNFGTKESIKAMDDSISFLNLQKDLGKRLKKAKKIKDVSSLFSYDTEGLCYLNGFDAPLPNEMVEALLDAKYNPNSRFTVNSLTLFYQYLMLNPDKHVRQGLFQWIRTSNFSLTEEGNIIAYRNVDVKKQGSDLALEAFVSESYGKVKKWKKSPKNYDVCADPTIPVYFLKENRTVGYNKDDYFFKGCLNELHDTELDSPTIYTDNHTRSMLIKLGEAVNMPRKECSNDPNDSCSAGLHNKSSQYSLNLGSEVLVTLVNPYNVVAIPTYDNTKFRSCEYFPVCKAEVVDDKLIEFKAGTYDLIYTGLDVLSKDRLENLINKGEVSEEITIDDFTKILDNAKDLLKNKIINV